MTLLRSGSDRIVAAAASSGAEMERIPLSLKGRGPGVQRLVSQFSEIYF